MLRRVYLLLPCILALALVSAGNAASYTWNTPAAGNWTDPTRWSPVGVPGQTDPLDTAIVGSGPGQGGTAILNAAAPSIASLNIGSQGQATLNVVPGGSLATTGTGDAIGLNGLGRLVMTGGQLTFGGRLDIDQAEIQHLGGTIQLEDAELGNINLGLAGAATWTAAATANLDVGGNLNVGHGGQGAFTQSSGQVLVRGNLSIGNVAGVGEYTFAGGALVVEDALRVGPSGDGTLHLGNSAGTLFAGSFQMFPTGTLAATLGGGTAVIEASSATLAGRLEATLAASLPPGTVKPLVLVGGNAPLATTFAGLPQGGVLYGQGVEGTTGLRISYAANIDGGPIANDVALTVLAPGDANFDQTVNRADLARLLRSFGGAGDWEMGDFSGDGAVGLADLLRLQRNQGSFPVAARAAVPEPGALALACAGLIALLVSRRRAAASNGRIDKSL